ncbi:PREDICTED: uncharacterized protein LOC106743288 [Dinoponera quadriceps]|uniref:Uncharacterized protein LOC106743288 n=1 Tax=Dinoponera quadriceps TaxID=609295 RepID=A0A6P3X2A4_DINQU|nr:PREDICTED: uncharacterized protein LOC106743288 [Dinoponera quadriceps]
MFESDDWICEVAFNDNHGATIQTHPQCQNKEETSTKRRKVDGYMASFFTGNDNSENELNVTKNTKDNNLSDSSKSNITREHLLLGIFQENIRQKETREKQHPQSSKTNTSSLSSHKEPKEKKDTNFANKDFGKKSKLIRIFPGPAGLVAHMKNDNTSVASYLNSVKELESKPAAEHIKSNFPKLSQDEKNLLSEKAWKFLLDDLPRNFFNEYGIFASKNRVNASHCNSMKVKFIAGILDYIDHSCDDPFIVLRDSTDSIEGTIHRDIPLKYPGILEPNVVVLLHDVGLLKTTTNVVMNKYHILVSRVNLLAVYSNKGRIIHTPCTENILSSISNIELTRDDCTPSISNYCDDTVERCATSSVSTSTNQQVNSKPLIVDNSTLLHRSNEKHESGKQAFDDNSKNSEAKGEIFEFFEYSMDMDDDAFFAVENKPVVSDEHKHFDRSSFEGTIAQTSEIQRCKVQTQNTDCLENAKGESSVIKPVDKMLSESPAMKYKAESSKNLVSYFTDKALHDNEYDSDDEILSQLNMDNIVNQKDSC